MSARDKKPTKMPTGGWCGRLIIHHSNCRLIRGNPHHRIQSPQKVNRRRYANERGKKGDTLPLYGERLVVPPISRNVEISSLGRAGTERVRSFAQFLT